MVFSAILCAFSNNLFEKYTFFIKLMKKVHFSHVQVSDFILGRGTFSLFREKGPHSVTRRVHTLFRGVLPTPERSPFLEEGDVLFIKSVEI
mgnify:CR=1 FL=1